MNIDLSFTQDLKWIAKREEVWEVIKDRVAEERTKKQFEAYHDYFFTGSKPKEELPSAAYVLYFPASSFDALSYVFNEFIDADKLRSDNLWEIETYFSLNLGLWPGICDVDKAKIFEAIYGKLYDPERKFPFLIGKETEYRDFVYGTDGLFTTLTGIYSGIAITEGHSDFFWLELVDFYISMFSYVSPWIFSREYTDEQKKKKVGGTRMRMFNKRMNQLMENLINPSEDIINADNYAIKKTCLDKLTNFFESVESPPELVEHWQWAKQEYGR